VHVFRRSGMTTAESCLPVGCPGALVSLASTITFVSMQPSTVSKTAVAPNPRNASTSVLDDCAEARLG
jgi:hypothetical protein